MSPSRPGNAAPVIYPANTAPPAPTMHIGDVLVMTPVFPPSTPRRVLSARRLILLATVANLGAAAVAIGIDGSHRSLLPALTTADAAQRPVGFGDLVEKVKPAVIAVRVKLNADAKAMGSEGELPPDLPIERFLRRFGMPEGGKLPEGMRQPRNRM